jgi:hypothetical protein
LHPLQFVLWNKKKKSFTTGSQFKINCKNMISHSEISIIYMYIVFVLSRPCASYFALEIIHRRNIMDCDG